MKELSPQLASHNPQIFKEELVGGLTERSVYGRHLWEAVVRAGNITFDAVHVNPGQWVSWSNAQRKEIHLGAEPLEPTHRKRLIYKDATINYEQEVNLRFLHEVGHLFTHTRIHTGSEQINDLWNVARTVRSIDQSLGLTAIGSLSFYNQEIKPHEDMAELMAMYAYNPDYLYDFLDYTTAPENAASLRKVGVASVPGYKNEIFKVVHDTVQEGIHR